MFVCNVLLRAKQHLRVTAAAVAQLQARECIVGYFLAQNRYNT